MYKAEAHIFQIFLSIGRSKHPDCEVKYIMC